MSSSCCSSRDLICGALCDFTDIGIVAPYTTTNQQASYHSVAANCRSACLTVDICHRYSQDNKSQHHKGQDLQDQGQGLGTEVIWERFGRTTGKNNNAKKQVAYHVTWQQQIKPPVIITVLENHAEVNKNVMGISHCIQTTRNWPSRPRT